MAMHTVVEFNHDKMAEIVTEKDFGKILNDLLRHAYIPTAEELLKRLYGVKIIERHHSSHCPHKDYKGL